MDNIFGNRFLGRAPAWHHLGTVIDPEENLTMVGAIELAGADYEVKTTKLVTEAFGKRIDTGRVAIVRAPLADDPEPLVLGTATKAYKPVQNRELAMLLEPIAADNDWRVETVGVLGKGERVFMTLEAGQVEIPGDTSGVTMYFFVTSGHDGGSAVKIGVTPVRIVCQNTLIMGLARATVTAAVTHTGDAVGNVAFNVEAIAQMQAAKSAVAEAMRHLAAAPTTTDGIEAILTAAYPLTIPVPAADRAREFLASTVVMTPERRAQLERVVAKADGGIAMNTVYRDAARDRLVIFNDEYPAVANTPWAVYNAVAETECYRRSKSDASASADLLFGWRGRAVANAFEQATAVARSN